LSERELQNGARTTGQVAAGIAYRVVPELPGAAFFDCTRLRAGLKTSACSEMWCAANEGRSERKWISSEQETILVPWKWQRRSREYPPPRSGPTCMTPMTVRSERLCPRNIGTVFGPSTSRRRSPPKNWQKALTFRRDRWPARRLVTPWRSRRHEGGLTDSSALTARINRCYAGELR
jgi:hypothetical protein